VGAAPHHSVRLEIAAPRPLSLGLSPSTLPAFAGRGQLSLAACFPSGAAYARAYYDPNLLCVLRGNLFVFLRDDEAIDSAGTKACLTALVGDVLAAH
jgi:hypothetical protein